MVENKLAIHRNDGPTIITIGLSNSRLNHVLFKAKELPVGIAIALSDAKKRR